MLTKYVRQVSEDIPKYVSSQDRYSGYHPDVLAYAPANAVVVLTVIYGLLS